MFFETKDIRVSYGSVEIIKGISIQIDKGKVICLLGANGAGKSTVLRAISSLVGLTNGQVYFDGERIDGLPPHEIVQKGITHVPEERRLFCEMSVLENLEMGAYRQPNRRKVMESLEEILSIFPPLRSRLNQRAGTLSGGEQQMTAVGRALMSKPRLLLMDEPTFGLSPLLCDAIVDWLSEIQQRGTSVLLSEQNAEIALEASNEAYILRLGEIVLHGSSQELMADERMRRAYMGI